MNKKDDLFFLLVVLGVEVVKSGVGFFNFFTNLSLTLLCTYFLVSKNVQ